MLSSKTISIKHDLKANILAISKLFNKLLVVYKYKFPTKLLQHFVPRIDFVKINLFKELILALIKNPFHIDKIQSDFYQEYLTIYSLEPNNSSKIIFLLLKKYWLKTLEPIASINHKNKRKLIYYVNHWLNSLANQKLLFKNSEFTPITIKNLQKNLLPSIKNFLNDLITNEGYFDIKTSGSTIFKIGENLATSPGKVICQNDLMELIQYLPTTSKVYKAPILFIPPCINKYYILDLSENNSLVKWLVSQGFTVYIISWINPKASLAHKTFSDYVIHGALYAIDIITQTNPSTKVHLAGYCMGGTILSCTLSYMQQTNDLRALSATHFMSPLDFSNLKDLNQNSLNILEKSINKTGYLDGRLLCTAFNIVHANELIWPYFINYYLLNKPLQSFDALYWNSDPVNLPATMYNFYLRNICFHNKLRQPNELKINNLPIDLNKVTVPIFSVAGEQDPISDWQTIYESIKLYSSSYNKKFVLSSCGHVMGLINSITDPGYSYKSSNHNKTNTILSETATAWLENSTEHLGSWWPYWLNWLTDIEPVQINTMELNTNINLNFLKDAPGDYVI